MRSCQLTFVFFALPAVAFAQNARDLTRADQPKAQRSAQDGLVQMQTFLDLIAEPDESTLEEFRQVLAEHCADQELIDQILESTNRTQIDGPVLLLQSISPDGSWSRTRDVASLLTVGEVVLQDDHAENDGAITGRVTVEAGGQVFEGDFIISGVIANTGTTSIVLQDSNGVAFVVDPGDLVIVAASGDGEGGCSVTCGGGTTACCGFPRTGPPRCVCTPPQPSFTCWSGGNGATSCTILPSA